MCQSYNPAPKRELLAYDLDKVIDLPKGKALYTLSLACLLEVAPEKDFDEQRFIETLWEEMCALPSKKAIGGIQVDEITEWPLHDEDALAIEEIPPALKKVYERIVPALDSSTQKLYNVFVMIISDDQKLTVDRLFPKKKR